MPHVWRFIAKQFSLLFFLTLLITTVVLVALRFQTIAQFAALSSNLGLTARFVGYQLPYILPFAFVIASATAAFSLTSQLSASHELTAMRLTGMAIHTLFKPVRCLLFGIALACAATTFTLIPLSKMRMQHLVESMHAETPFLLLQNGKTLAHKNRSILFFPQKNNPKAISDICTAVYNTSTQALDLALIKELHLSETMLTAKNAAFITPQERFLLLENVHQLTFPANKLTALLTDTTRSPQPQHGFIADLCSALQKTPSPQLAFELLRRLFSPLSVYSLGMVALYSGIFIERKKRFMRSKSFIISVALIIFCFIIGKSAPQTLSAGISLFLLPHPCILGLSRYIARRHELGHAS